MSIGFGVENEPEPLTVTEVPKKKSPRLTRKQLSACFIAVVMAVAGILFFTVGTSSHHAGSVAVKTVEPSDAESATSVPFGTTLEVNSGWSVKATRNFTEFSDDHNGVAVLFANNGQANWSLGQYGFGYVLPDGTVGPCNNCGGLGRDHDQVTLKPGEKFTSQLVSVPPKSTLVMVTNAYGPEQEVARWS